MSINKKTFNDIALADNADELIKRVLDALKEVSTPKPGGGITPSIPTGHHDPYCRDIFSHMRGLSSVREIMQYFLTAIGMLRQTGQDFCANKNYKNFEGFRDAWLGFHCVIKYIIMFIPGSTMPNILNNLINYLGPGLVDGFPGADVKGLDTFSDEDELQLHNYLCVDTPNGGILRRPLLDFDVETWEDLFNVTQLIPIPQPITCPPYIPINTSLPWWEEFMLWALQDVDPSDLEAAGNAAACVGIAAGVLATGGAAAPYVCTLGAGELAAATAALALVVSAERAAAIEQALLEVSQSCGNSCCVEGVVAEGVDSSEECYELGGDWGSESCKIGPHQREK